MYYYLVNVFRMDSDLQALRTNYRNSQMSSWDEHCLKGMMLFSSHVWFGMKIPSRALEM